MNKESSFAAKFMTALAMLTTMMVVLWLLLRIGSVIVYFAISISIAYLLNPLVDWLEKWRTPRVFSILFIFGIFTSGVVLAGFILVPIISDQGKELVDNFPRYAAGAKEMLDDYSGYLSHAQLVINKYRILDNAASKMQAVGNNIATSITMSIMSFFSYLPGLIVIPIIVFYLLKDGHNIRKGFISSLPEGFRRGGGLLMDRINHAVGGFIRGQLKLCLIIGFISWFGMAVIARVPYALIMGVIAGVTEFIPYLGPILGMILPLIVAAFMGWEKAALVVIIFVVIQTLENNLLAPRIMGSNIGMHPILIIFAMMAGGQAAGLAGMLAALPLAVLIKAFYEHFYLEKYVLHTSEMRHADIMPTSQLQSSSDESNCPGQHQ